MVVEAMTQLGKPYDVRRILEIGVKIDGEKGFWTRDLFEGKVRREALICSTLYADSHNAVADKDIGENSGVVMPAYLSQCSDFTDIQLEWARISND